MKTFNEAQLEQGIQCNRKDGSLVRNQLITIFIKGATK